MMKLNINLSEEESFDVMVFSNTLVIITESEELRFDLTDSQLLRLGNRINKFNIDYNPAYKRYLKNKKELNGVME